jgi:hypothetical protein
MSHDADPVALVQGADDVGADGHAADLLDLAAGDRLAIGDQGQGLQQGPGIALRTLLPQAPDPGLSCSRTWKRKPLATSMSS